MTNHLNFATNGNKVTFIEAFFMIKYLLNYGVLRGEPMLNKNDILTDAVIEGYTSEGLGVARADGRAVFVHGALRGETCDIRILKVGKTAVYAKIEKLITPSKHRAEPICPAFRTCGGCALMHMDYAEELFFKKERVENALKRIGGIDLALDAINGAEKCLRYRNKAIYAVSDAGGRAATGFFRARSHDVISVTECPIQSEYADRAALAVRTWMDRYHIPAYDEKTGGGLVRHVFCRYGFKSGEGQVTLVTSGGRLRHAEKLVDIILEKCPETVSIVHNTNETRGNTVLAGHFAVLWGREQIEDELCSLRFSLSPRSFYQVNRDQAEKLYEKAVEYAGLTGRETVIDLYCGTGTITLCMARGAGKAIGAEIVEAAVEDARRNAERNGVQNAEFICADAGKAAALLKERGVRPDVVVVDPPRKGLSADVIETIAEMSPDRVVYVSCDPATLSRDLRLFSALSYAPQKAEAFDLFPRTSHVETVCLLSRK